MWTLRHAQGICRGTPSRTRANRSLLLYSASCKWEAQGRMLFRKAFLIVHFISSLVSNSSALLHLVKYYEFTSQQPGLETKCRAKPFLLERQNHFNLQMKSNHVDGCFWASFRKRHRLFLTDYRSWRRPYTGSWAAAGCITVMWGELGPQNHQQRLHCSAQPLLVTGSTDSALAQGTFSHETEIEPLQYWYMTGTDIWQAADNLYRSLQPFSGWLSC